MWLVEPKPLKATITAVNIDHDGDPWFDLEFDCDHNPVRVDRSDLAKISRSYLTTGVLP